MARAAIIGVGLIGGSWGMALLRRGVAEEVVGYDTDSRSLQRALELGAINRTAASLAEAVDEAELVVVAVPVGLAGEVAVQALHHSPPEAVVTDVASVKQPVMTAVAAAGAGAAERFVGGHPMTGSERAGVEAADPYLFENAIYLLVPPHLPDASPESQVTSPLPETCSAGKPSALARVTRWVRSIGGLPLTVDADAHDRMVAAVSHLPHMVAVALVQAAARTNATLPLTLALAAGGFRDTTRIASGDPRLWTEILLANAGAILEAARSFTEGWEELLAALARQDRAQLENLLAYSRRVRQSLPVRQKGYLQPFYELVVELEDRPGAIAEVTGIVAQAGISIADIEILRAREGFGGTLRLAMESERARDHALLLLGARGFRCRPR